jgi:PAS domain S-box-containing protein
MKGPKSVRRKVAVAVFAAIGVSLALCAAGLGIYEYKAAEARMRSSLESLSDALLGNLVSAVDFGVPEAAKEALGRVQRGEAINAAALFRADAGEGSPLFADYQREGRSVRFALMPRPDGFYVDGDSALLVTTFSRDGRAVASLQLEGSLATVRRSFGESLRVLAGVFVVLLAVGAVLSRFLQRAITQPIVQLAETARAVRTSDNYALRAPVATDDELGQLGRQFNEMLAGIAERDREIAANHALQRAILSGAGVAVISTDPSGVVRSFNPAAERLLGYRAEEVVGCATPEQWHDRAEVAARARELTVRLGRPVAPGFDVFVASIPEGGSDGREWTFVGKQSNRASVYLVISELRSAEGTLLGYVGLATDLTERRRREHALRSFSELTGTVTGREFFKATVRQLAHELGVTTALIGELFIGPDGRQTVRTLAVWVNGPVENLDYELSGTPCENVTRDGLCHYADAVAAQFPADALLVKMGARSYAGLPMRDHTGRVLGVIAVLDDKPMPGVELASLLLVLSATRAVAELQRLRNEEQITQLNADLEVRVEQRTAELATRVAEVERLNVEQRELMRNLTTSEHAADRSAARLQEANSNLLAANQELEAFSYSVSHDLRAPLRNITGFLELLEKRMAGRIDGESARFVSVVIREAGRMGLLIDDLLTFSRIGRAEMSEELVLFDVLIAEVREELASEIGAREIEWKIGALPPVRGDRSLLRQVIANLVGNAVKFTRQQPKAVIEIGASVGRAGAGSVTFFVRDNGAGFNPRFIDKLFGVFQRLHNSREFEGTGIGLANVKRIVQRHGGRVWAEGAVNNGAVFYFTLPPAARADVSRS